MLPESRLYTFIDSQSNHLVYFLEGQKIIEDLAVIQQLKGVSFQSFRDFLMHAVFLNVFIKPQETLGIYIDSTSPYFRFKLEMNADGQYRSLFLPNELTDDIHKINGLCRISKVLPSQTEPYNSVVEVKDSELEEIIGQVLSTSYQVSGNFYPSDKVDQNLFISKLPKKNVDQIQATPEITTVDYIKEKASFFERTYQRNMTDEMAIVAAFKKEGFEYLQSKEINFQCQCSRNHLLKGLLAVLRTTSIDQLFGDDSSIETRCDYCKMHYQFDKEEILELVKE